jgi:hypothetical protein
MFFYQNAEVDKVKLAYVLLGWEYAVAHFTRHERLYDDSTGGWDWDKDKGVRETNRPLPAIHMRVNAPYPEDRFYDMDLGYFVIGTVHWDDGIGGEYKTEEEAEDVICALAKNILGYTVYEDYCWISTKDGGTNNGYVSYVCVP